MTVVAKDNCRVAPDGGTTFTYKKGEIVHPTHAQWMLDKKLGVVKTKPATKKKKDAGAAPENKARN